MLSSVANQPMSLGDSLLLSGIGMLVVIMELSLLAVMIILLSKGIRAFTGKKSAAPAPAAVVSAAAPVVAAPVVSAAPVLTLTDVDEPAAAAVMAIVSDKTGIPLSHLAFHSIKGVIELKGVSDEEAAVIMALTADKLGVPVNKLIFKSIKNV